MINIFQNYIMWSMNICSNLSDMVFICFNAMAWDLTLSGTLLCLSMYLLTYLCAYVFNLAICLCYD